MNSPTAVTQTMRSLDIENELCEHANRSNHDDHFIEFSSHAEPKSSRISLINMAKADVAKAKQVGKSSISFVNSTLHTTVQKTNQSVSFVGSTLNSTLNTTVQKTNQSVSFVGSTLNSTLNTTVQKTNQSVSFVGSTLNSTVHKSNQSVSLINSKINSTLNSTVHKIAQAGETSLRSSGNGMKAILSLPLTFKSEGDDCDDSVSSHSDDHSISKKNKKQHIPGDRRLRFSLGDVSLSTKNLFGNHNNNECSETDADTASCGTEQSHSTEKSDSQYNHNIYKNNGLKSCIKNHGLVSCLRKGKFAKAMEAKQYEEESFSFRRCSRRNGMGMQLFNEPTAICFDTVQVREYERILGDNPSVRDMGAPLSIGWSYNPESAQYSVDEYEDRRCIVRRNETDLFIPSLDRDELLSDWGYSSSEIDEALAEVGRVRYHRQKTISKLMSKGKLGHGKFISALLSNSKDAIDKTKKGEPISEEPLLNEEEPLEDGSSAEF